MREKAAVAASGGAKAVPKDEDVDAFVERQLELVRLECTTEEQQALTDQETHSLKQLELKGVALATLTITDKKSGLGGRTLVTLERLRGGVCTPLPAHRFSNGDIVALRDASSAGPATKQQSSDIRGLVFRTSETKLTIAVDTEAGEEVEGTVHVFKAANDVTYKRYRKVMSDLKEEKDNTRMRSLLFCGGGTLQFRPRPGERTWKPVNDRLNESQLNAIDLALSAADIAVIHGPPGTGKTTTVVELIVQAVKRGEKVLATAPSNIAVDNIAERLAALKINIVRIGHPARVLESVIGCTMDMRVHVSDSKALARDAMADINNILCKIGKEKKGERASLRKELGELRKEVRRREDQAIKEVLKASSVVLCTNAGAADNSLRDAELFDLCVIDEAAMALEVSCWIPILRSKRLVLAGDHCQLAPTIMSEEAARLGLGRTLFDRVVDMYPECVSMLDTQYRMHAQISDWSSEAMYGGKLLSGDDVRERTLDGLTNVAACDDTHAPMILIDTTGCDLGEDKDEAGSTRNEGEVLVAREHLARLLAAGLKQDDVGILAPYNAQVACLRDKLRDEYPQVEIGTVDGFQGREKEAIILTLVRSNPRREVGFLSDDRRLNVAITRAKRQVCIVCDCETVSSHPFLKGLLDYCEENGVDYRSAMEYMPEGAVHFSRGDIGEKLLGAKGRGKKSDKEAGPKLTDEEKEDARARVATRLDAFLADKSASELVFEASLNAFERLAVHEYCEKVGLMHESVGEKEARYITARKRPLATAPSAAQKPESTSSVACLGSTADGAQSKGRAETARSGGDVKVSETGAGDDDDDDDDLRHTGNAFDALSGLAEKEHGKDRGMGGKEQDSDGAKHGKDSDRVPISSDSLTEAAKLDRERREREKVKDILVKICHGKNTHELHVRFDETVEEVKERLEHLTFVSKKMQKFMYKKVLNDDLVLSQVVPNNSKIMMLGEPTLNQTPNVLGVGGVGGGAGMTAQLHAERLARERERAEKEQKEKEELQRQQAQEREAAGTAWWETESAEEAAGRAGKGKKKSKKTGAASGGGVGGGGVKISTTEKDPEEEEDIDALLQELDMNRGVSSCGLRGCKAGNLELLGKVCPFCKLRFCLQHSMPEVHGCGEEVKAAARKEWERDAARAKERDTLLHAGRPLETGWKQNKEAVLKGELKKKIAEQQEGRARKGDDDKKDGGKKKKR